MPDISIQFYATPPELCRFVEEVLVEFGLHAVVMRFSPFETKEVKNHDLSRFFNPDSEFYRWAFTVDPPHVPVEHELAHADRNPDHLRLDVGKYESNSISQSWLSCRTEDRVSYLTWKKVAKKLKAMTFAGVTARNRQNGKQAEYRQFRYTQGAKELEDSGITMLSTAGAKGPEIKLGLLLSHPAE